MDKRSFLKKASVLGVLPFTYPKFIDFQTDQNKPIGLPSHASTQEVSSGDYWATIRDQYDLTSDYINLESGYYNIIPNFLIL